MNEKTEETGNGWQVVSTDRLNALTSERDEAVRQVEAMRSFVELLRTEEYLTARFFADEIESRLAAALPLTTDKAAQG